MVVVAVFTGIVAAGALAAYLRRVRSSGTNTPSFVARSRQTQI